jgi:AAA domain, putative AbiEii toxin, Type IV TA system
LVGKTLDVVYEGKMLRSLKLVGVGPAAEMEMQFASRLNVLTGDNGLGKSLFLEAIWYVLTGNWAGLPIWPRKDSNSAHLEATFTNSDRIEGSSFIVDEQRWKNLARYNRRPLTISSRVDGGIAIWDPVVNANTLPNQRHEYLLSANEVLDGKSDKSFRGLIEDVVTWQGRPSESPGGTAFKALCDILQTLSPNPDAEDREIIRISKPIRLFLHDKREFPTIDNGYGETPIIHVSAGMQRIISLAYAIVWAWQEHLEMCRLVKKEPTKQIVFLMDEVENHLHPEWQRRILPAILNVLESLGEGMQVQMHVTTHSPMVLASLEPHWDNAKDELFHFALKDGKVTLGSEELITRGDATRWLTSHVFGLHWARSVEAERALEDARAFMQGDEPKYFKTPEEVDAQLRHTLPGQDPFWPRWNIYMGDSES